MIREQVLPEEKQKGFYALILPVILAVFSILLTMGIGFGVLPQFVHGQLGYSTVIVGLVIGLQNITALCTRATAGRNTDTRGAKSSVSRGILWVVLSGAGYMLATLFTGVPLLSLSLLLLARIMHGIGESYLITGALTWGIGLAGVQRSGKVMAWVGISLYAGIGLGAPLGDFVSHHGGLLLTFALVSLLPLAGSMPMFRLPAIAPASPKRDATFFKVAALISGQGSSLALSAIGFGCISSFVALFFQSRGWGDASMAFTLFASTYIATRLLFATYPDKYGGYKIGAISIIIEIAGQLLLWLAAAPAMALAGCALTGIGFSLMFPAMGVEAVKKVKPGMRGSAMGAYTAFTDLALGITGPLAGIMASYFGYQAIYLLGTICSILSLLLIFLNKKSR